MSIADTAKTVIDLAKKGMTVEFQEKIMQLREEALALQEENLRLRSENLELKKKAELQETVSFSKNVYWRDGDKVPFCPSCFDKDKRLVHIHLCGRNGPQLIYQCPACATQYGRRGEEVCEERFWRPYAAARSDFQYVSHKPLW